MLLSRDFLYHSPIQHLESAYRIAAKSGHYVDVIGDPMTVGDDLFTSVKGDSKVKKRDRHLYIDELAQTIADPDEIYLEAEKMQTGKRRLVKKLFRYFEDEKGRKKSLMAIFEYHRDKTAGVTIHVIDTAKGVERRRIEKLIYQKKTP